MSRRGRRFADAPTSAERAALMAVCQPGVNEALAARHLGITEAALRSRLRSLYGRLGVNSAAQAFHAIDPLRDHFDRFLAEYIAHRNDPHPTSLYRYFDERGRLMYVGITSGGGRRADQHQASAPWWTEVRTATIEHYPDRRSALTAESIAITAEAPIHNRAGAPKR